MYFAAFLMDCQKSLYDDQPYLFDIIFIFAIIFANYNYFKFRINYYSYLPSIVSDAFNTIYILYKIPYLPMYILMIFIFYTLAIIIGLKVRIQESESCYKDLYFKSVFIFEFIRILCALLINFNNDYYIIMSFVFLLFYFEIIGVKNIIDFDNFVSISNKDYDYAYHSYMHMHLQNFIRMFEIILLITYYYKNIEKK
jgi:hypothetical protein